MQGVAVLGGGPEPLSRLSLEGSQPDIVAGTGRLADGREQESVAAGHLLGTVSPIQEILIYYLMGVQVVGAT